MAWLLPTRMKSTVSLISSEQECSPERLVEKLLSNPALNLRLSSLTKHSMIVRSVDSVTASMTRLSGPSRLKMVVFWLSREAGSLSFWV